MNYYQKEYRKDLRKIIATKIASYKNFKDFMLKVSILARSTSRHVTELIVVPWPAYRYWSAKETRPTSR